MSLDKALYRFARTGRIKQLMLQGISTTIGAETFDVLLKDSTGKILLATGLTVPTDAGAGFAKGCIFIDTNVGAGTTGQYINVGSITACNFDVSGTVSAGSVALSDLTALTQGQIIRAGAAGALEAYSAKTVGKFLIGDGTDVISATMSSHATVSATGAITIAAACITPAMMTATALQYAEIAISAADIVSVAAGKFGHAQGQILVASAGATTVMELVSAIMIYDWDTSAQYGGGGNITVNYDSGGTALTGLIASTSLTTAADSITYFHPLTATATSLTKNKGFNLVTSGAFTTGGAVGVIRVKLTYRVHTHGLA